MRSVGDGLVAIGAALAVFVGVGTSIGQGWAAAKAVEATGKNPDAVNEIRGILILGAGLVETAAIYGMLIAFMIIFVL